MLRCISWMKKWKMLPFLKNAEIRPKGRPGGKMEESASHHFLLRLRRRKRIFNAPGPSQIHFLKLWTNFQKIEIFIIFGPIFLILAPRLDIRKFGSRAYGLNKEHVSCNGQIWSLMLSRLRGVYGIKELKKSHDSEMGRFSPKGAPRGEDGGECFAPCNGMCFFCACGAEN